MKIKTFFQFCHNFTTVIQTEQEDPQTEAKVRHERKKRRKLTYSRFSTLTVIQVSIHSGLKTLTY